MSKRPVTLTLELCPDEIRRAQVSPEAFLDVVRILDSEINRPGVRERIADSPMSELNFLRLRWLLMVVRRSGVQAPRPLTWRERITGRLNP